MFLLITACCQFGNVWAQPCPSKDLSSTIVYNDGMVHTWDGTHAPPSNPILKDVVISNNSTLIIDGITVNFADNVSISVDGSGAAHDAPQLTIRNSAILQKQSCGNNWAGINVIGSDDGSFNFTDYVNTGGVWSIASNALVTVNHSTIKNATVGITSTKLGILQISNNSSFIDNKTSISIDEGYWTDANVTSAMNYFAGLTSPGPTCSSASFIQDCTFDFQTPWPGNSDFYNQYHIYLTGVKYLELAGNTFTCTYASALDATNKRGWGIKARNSSFALHESGSATISSHCRTFTGGTRNKFEYLYIGITTTGTSMGDPFNNPDYTMGIVNCDFTGCVAPIYSNFGNHLVMSGCNLTTTSGNTAGKYNTSINSIYIYFTDFESSHNMLVNKNTFSSDFAYTDFIKIDEGGNAQSSVYNNTMTYSGSTITAGVSEYGVQYIGSNTGALIRCNTFSGNKYDIYCDNAFNKDIGTSAVDANNTFSASGPNYINLYNATAYDIKYHSQLKQPSTTYGSVTAEIGAGKSETCPDITDCGVWLLGINDKPMQDYHFNIFPNPANDVLHIRYESPNPISKLSMVIYDIQGRELGTNLLNDFGNGTDVNTSNLQTGLYIFKVFEGETSVKQGKFVISR